MEFRGVEWVEQTKVPEELIQEIEQMLDIDFLNLKGNLNQVIHDSSQVLKTIYELTVAVNEAEVQVKETSMIAIKFYNFESKRKLTATQVTQALKNDKDIADEEFKLKVLKAQLEYFEGIYHELKQKSRNIKTIIEWEIFTQGNR